MPWGVWVLGCVSLLMDVSSEMIHSLLPVFLVTVLGASATTIGAIEGIGEATASMTKLFSGWLSDRLARRKALTIAGYGLGALSKPIFAWAPSPAWILAARFSDRVGKGVRGAPRDALIAEIAPPALRGAAYGLRQSLDTAGAFAGPLAAIALMQWSANDFRLVFSLAVIPAVLAVLLLAFAVHEPAALPRQPSGRRIIDLAELRQLDGRFWEVVAVAGVLTMARFSEAFLLLRAQELGLAASMVPLVLVVMNVVYTLSAYPMGALSDRLDRRLVLAAGFAVLIAADLALASAATLTGLMIGISLWGFHMGMTQGQFAALIADAAPPAVRGTAFGIFHFTSGIALLIASLLAGWLWQRFGSPATFACGVLLTAAGLIGFVTSKARSSATAR